MKEQENEKYKDTPFLHHLKQLGGGFFCGFSFLCYFCVADLRLFWSIIRLRM
jgi:hypothetical protein